MAPRQTPTLSGCAHHLAWCSQGVADVDAVKCFAFVIPAAAGVFCHRIQTIPDYAKANAEVCWLWCAARALACWLILLSRL